MSEACPSQRGVEAHRRRAEDTERLRRWRLLLGAPAGPCLGLGAGSGAGLGPSDRAVDAALAALYEGGGQEAGGRGERSAGLGASSPRVARWLGDIRTYFPTSAVRVMQQDALDRLHLTEMLLEPEILEQIEPDVHLVASLISLGKVIPDKTKETARLVVRKVVDELERKLAAPLLQAVRG